VGSKSAVMLILDRCCGSRRNSLLIAACYTKRVAYWGPCLGQQPLVWITCASGWPSGLTFRALSVSVGVGSNPAYDKFLFFFQIIYSRNITF